MKKGGTSHAPPDVNRQPLTAPLRLPFGHPNMHRIASTKKAGATKKIML
jgi:hypothetical protein